MIEKIKKYVEQGWLISQRHPRLPLTIYNYSQSTQYAEKWDEITLMCRGLVIDDDGNIVARPFKKFFNYEELKPEEIPNEEFDVFEKIDGSLGILFNYNGEWILASRGSFTSDQAIRGTEILKKYRYDRLLKGYTYLFEIIYPENRIVCQYDYEELILLGVIDNNDGYEMRVDDDRVHLYGNRIKNVIGNLGFKFVKKYDGLNDFSKLKELISDDAEGFVIRFQSGMRMKIKGKEYVRLHRIVTCISSYDVWEGLKSRGEIPEELLERVPDEFYQWIEKTEKQIRDEYDRIEKEYLEYFDSIKELGTRKLFAESARNFQYPKILFLMLDGTDYSGCIWNLVKPGYCKPFAER
jgi:RNA ligase